MDKNKREFYYNAIDDIWQELPCSQNNIEYRLRQLEITDSNYSFVYLPMTWSVERLSNRIIELILSVKELRIEDNNIVETADREWTIDCDFDNSQLQGWPVSITRNADRHWRNGFVCGSNITFPQLLAANYVDIPASVIDIAIEHLRDLAKDKFGFRPTYLGDVHGLVHMIAFCVSPLDPNIYILKDVLGNESYTRILQQGGFNSYKELCRVLEIENPPPSLRKAYVRDPESIIVYIFMRQCGFNDINIIRRFFYRERIMGYRILNLKYDCLSGMLSMSGRKGHDISNFIIFSHWLLRHRSEKALAARFLRWFNDNITNIASDNLRMFTEVQIDENEDLISPALRHRLFDEWFTQEVHDSLVEELFVIQPDAVNHFYRRRKMNYENKIYEYKEKEMALESTEDIYSFILPKDSNELRSWGNIFHNCVAGYNSAILDKYSIILAMKEHDKYIACIEIRQSTIVQALGYCNQRLPAKYREIIGNWADKKKVFYKDKPKRIVIRQ